MMLTELLQTSTLPFDVAVRGIADDSRAVEPGDLFCALSGDQFDGRGFVADAVARGAVAVACEPPLVEADVPVVEVADLRARLGELAGRVYGDPSHDIAVVAVTGTNGKTSFTHLLAQALIFSGLPSGIIGTMGYGVPGAIRDPGLTTPGAVDLQTRIKRLVDDECLAIVLEASSHGLDQDRLNGVAVDTAVLTNLTHDHLDYHATLADYRAAKQRLFELDSVSNAVLNLDDEFGRDLTSQLGNGISLTTYSCSDPTATVFCQSVEFTPAGLNLTLVIDHRSLDIQLPLLGGFNIENALAVAAAMRAMGYGSDLIQKAMNQLQPVKGRMEIIAKAGKPSVIVDYAHTPDALQKALEAVRQHFPERSICCVFGCGGDRDRSKRAVMGEIAESLAAKVILTSDNPRSEDPDQILAEIAGVVPTRMLKIVDRREAILHAIRSADSTDVILVAGKGHEEYQVLRDGRVPFSDYQVISDGLESWSATDGTGKDD